MSFFQADEFTLLKVRTIMDYLKATGFRLGLLVNFGNHPKLDYERIAR